MTIHHANCLTDMITAFSNPEILRKNIHIRCLFPDGSEESGCESVDLRDTLCHFLKEFHEWCTLEKTCKVPFIRHNYTYKTWKAITRIFLNVYNNRGYLLIKLTFPFMQEVLFGSIYTDVIESFLYVSCSEKDSSPQLWIFFPVADEAELLNLLDNYGC